MAPCFVQQLITSAIVDNRAEHCSWSLITSKSDRPHAAVVVNDERCHLLFIDEVIGHQLQKLWLVIAEEICRQKTRDSSVLAHCCRLRIVVNVAPGDVVINLDGHRKVPGSQIVRVTHNRFTSAGAVEVDTGAGAGAGATYSITGSVAASVRTGKRSLAHGAVHLALLPRSNLVADVLFAADEFSWSLYFAQSTNRARLSKTATSLSQCLK